MEELDPHPQSGFSPQPPRRFPGGVATLLALTVGVQAQATFMVMALPTIAPSVAADIGVPASYIGFQMSLTYIAAVLASFPSGGAVRRFGAGTMSIIALIACGLGCLAIGSANLYWLAIGSLFLGCGYALINPAASHVLQRYTTPQRHSLLYSIKQTGVPLGAVMAGLILPTLTVKFGWQNALFTAVTLTGLVIAGLILFLRILNSDLEREISLRTEFLGAPRLIYAQPHLRALAAVTFCFSSIQMALMTFVVTILVDELHWSIAAAGSAASLMQLIGAAARIGWGIIGDYMKNSLLLLLLIGLITVISAGLWMLSPRMPVALNLVILSLFGASSIGWNGVLMGEISRVSGGRNVSAAIAGVMMFGFLGVVIGPLIFGVLYRILGSGTLTMAWMALFPASGMAVLYSSLRKSKTAPRNPG